DGRKEHDEKSEARVVSGEADCVRHDVLRTGHWMCRTRRRTEARTESRLEAPELCSGTVAGSREAKGLDRGIRIRASLQRCRLDAAFEAPSCAEARSFTRMRRQG